MDKTARTVSTWSLVSLRGMPNRLCDFDVFGDYLRNSVPRDLFIIVLKQVPVPSLLHPAKTSIVAFPPFVTDPAAWQQSRMSKTSNPTLSSGPCSSYQDKAGCMELSRLSIQWKALANRLKIKGARPNGRQVSL